MPEGRAMEVLPRVRGRENPFRNGSGFAVDAPARARARGLASCEPSESEQR